MPRTPSLMAHAQNTKLWWYTNKMTLELTSHSYLLPCMSARRMKPSTVGIIVQSMLRHTCHLQVDPPYWTNNTDPHQCQLDNTQQYQSCYCWQDNANNNNNANITIHAAQVDSTMQMQAEEDYIPNYIDYDNPIQDQIDAELTFYTEVYAAAIRMADDTELNFNCKEKGHFWCQCTKPLKEEFQQLVYHPKQKDNELNKKGGPRRKGGRVPHQCQQQHQCLLWWLWHPSKQQHQTPSILQ